MLKEVVAVPGQMSAERTGTDGRMIVGVHYRF